MKCLRKEAGSQVKVKGKENNLEMLETVAETHLKRRCIQHRKIDRKDLMAFDKRSLESNKSFIEETWHQDYRV